MARKRRRVDTEVHVRYPDGGIEVWTDMSFSSEDAERKLCKLYYRAEMERCEILKTVVDGQEYGC